MISKLKIDLHRLANPKKKQILQKFFKTGLGQYGEGDIFLGITVPESRKIAKKYENLSLKDTTKLLKSKIHEERLVALLVLVQKFKEIKERKQIVDFYLKHTKKINNWDLVDLSAPKILGMYFLDKDKSILYKLAQSQNLWDKRIGIISTHTFILNNKFQATLKISEILLNDDHDLIHKAVGWMLREVGKKDVDILEKFLKKNYKKMPRTMLRYAIEKFPEKTRKSYLNGLI